MSLKYNEEQIQSLEVLQAMRQKLGMYFGSNGNEAVHHVVQEIISNAIDEHLAGFGNKIQIIVKDDAVVVRDFARGIPLGKITEVATVPHSSGKFKDIQNQNDAYSFSGGLNGIGLKLATSTGTLTIISFRDGKMKKGIYRVDSIEEFDEKTTDQPNGTLVSWSPDAEPFRNDTAISFEVVQSKLETLSYLLPEMTFELHNSIKALVIKSEGMLGLFNDYLYTDDTLVKPYFKEVGLNNSQQKLEVKMGVTFNAKSNIERSYVNLIPTADHGTHITAFKTVLTRQFNSFFNTDFTGDEIRKHLSFIVAINTTLEPTFIGQAKSQLKMPELNTDLNSIYKEIILDMFEARKKEFQVLIKMMEKIKKASDVDKILKQITGKKKTKTGLANISSKYSGCQKEEGIELFLTEGLSAKGGLELSKSPVYQAVYAMKGKILNCFSKDLEEVIKNDEIQEIISILGDSKAAIKKFKKIVIAADADFDGAQIVNLTLGFLATFYKELFFKGLIYIPALPKYIARKDTEVKFMFTEEEKSQIPKSWDISYLKGLGEMNPEDLGLFTVNDSTRQLIQVKVSEENFEEFYNNLSLALSKNSEDALARKVMFME